MIIGCRCCSALLLLVDIMIVVVVVVVVCPLSVVIVGRRHHSSSFDVPLRRRGLSTLEGLWEPKGGLTNYNYLCGGTLRLKRVKELLRTHRECPVSLIPMYFLLNDVVTRSKLSCSTFLRHCSRNFAHST